MKPLRAAYVLLTANLLAGVVQAENFYGIATVSDTLAISPSRLCMGTLSTPPELGCPSYAPSLTTAGDVSITGNLSAAKFIGDGSGLTGLSTSADRITSGTTSILVRNAGPISFTTAGTTAMVISGSNVGIGTATPTAPLTIKNGLGNNFLELYSTGKAGNVVTFNDNGDITGSWGATGKYQIQTGSGSQTAGFGIGNTLGNFNYSGAFGRSNAIGSDEAFAFGKSNSVSGYTSAAFGLGITNNIASSVMIGPNNTAKITILTGGNVGIGTTSPGKTLDVSGTAKISSNTEIVGIVSATEVKVASSGAACTEATYGTMRLNAAKNRLEICRP